MAGFANIRPEQIHKARKVLQELPEKTKRKTRREAACILESDLRKALKKGYGPRELCTLLKNEGIIIPTYLIKEFCAGRDDVPPLIFPEIEENEVLYDEQELITEV